jgi:hypothetical protein
MFNTARYHDRLYRSPLQYTRSAREEGKQVCILSACRHCKNTSFDHETVHS